MTARTTIKKVRRTRVSGKKAQYFDEVIRLYFQEGLTGPEICDIIPIHNSNVYRWINEYEENKTNCGTVDKENKPKDMIRGKRVSGIIAPEEPNDSNYAEEKSHIVEADALEQRVRQLEHELSQARIERDLYKEIISVAEKKFNIQIRKKAGTKQ